MHELTKLIRDDMKPALGVTEPAAIAFAVSTARNYVTGDVENVTLYLNSGIYKNAFTCGIPGTGEVGNAYAAALGAVAADPEKGLECLEGISEEEKQKAARMVAENRIHVVMKEVTARIMIDAVVCTAGGSTAAVTIRDSHTNIVRITADGNIVYEKVKEPEKEGAQTAGEDCAMGEHALIHRYSLQQIYEYVVHVPAEELAFISEAYRLNWELMQEGLRSEKTVFAHYLLEANGGVVISEDERRTASLLCNAAIEARVTGLARPAMSITGSGAHGIIATMPLYAVCKVRHLSEESLLRATALSYLVCMYLKEYSGRLSAFCGCAIAAGTGMACGLVFLRGGDAKAMGMAISNMACSITGMICDGGNQGCTMKGVVAVDAAFVSADMAMKQVAVDRRHGINAGTPEETMRNMGLIASPGMTGTEQTILDILNQKGNE